MLEAYGNYNGTKFGLQDRWYQSHLSIKGNKQAQTSGHIKFNNNEF